MVAAARVARRRAPVRRRGSSGCAGRCVIARRAVLSLVSAVTNARELSGLLGDGAPATAPAPRSWCSSPSASWCSRTRSRSATARAGTSPRTAATASPPRRSACSATLSTPVEAIAFFRSDTPGKKTAEDLLKQYASYSNGKLTWRMEDPDRAPGLARRYGVETYGTVVLERDGQGRRRKSEKILDAEEEKLTNGLVKVTREGKRVVYVLKGHGELDIANTDRPGLSQAKEQLETRQLRGQGADAGAGPEGPRRRRHHRRRRAAHRSPAARDRGPRRLHRARRQGPRSC